jgi:hypothetical protein
MSRPLLAKDVTLTVTFTAAALTGDTIALPSTTALSVVCLAKSFSSTITQNMINATALCAVYEASLSTTQAGSLSIELYVDSVLGPIFASKLGFGCEIDVDLDGAGTVAGAVIKYFGMVTEAGLSLTPEETQTETATIKLGVSGITGLYGA